MIDAILFGLCAATALGSALLVVVQRSPIGSAFSLIVTLVSLSVIYALLGSPFVAVLQVIVYAGAIMVLFLFVLMLLGARHEEPAPRASRGLRVAGVGLGLALAVEVAWVLARAKPALVAPRLDASTKKMAEVLFGAPYAYVFEATAVLILAALVGAVVLAKREL
jgi:NADH-quinone oxidoreductase subunit J